MTNSGGEQENKSGKAGAGNKEPSDSKQKRPPSTVGEIVIAIFVAVTAVIYAILV